MPDANSHISSGIILKSQHKKKAGDVTGLLCVVVA